MKSTGLWIVHHCLRIGLGAVFVVAGILKLNDLAGFADHVGDFGLVYDSFVKPAAWVVILLELAVGLGLVLNLRGSLAGVALLLGGFIGILLYGIGMGLDICQGTS